MYEWFKSFTIRPRLWNGKNNHSFLKPSKKQGFSGTTFFSSVLSGSLCLWSVGKLTSTAVALLCALEWYFFGWWYFFSEKNALCHLCTQYSIMKWKLTEEESVEMETKALLLLLFFKSSLTCSSRSSTSLKESDIP